MRAVDQEPGILAAPKKASLGCVPHLQSQKLGNGVPLKAWLRKGFLKFLFFFFLREKKKKKKKIKKIKPLKIKLKRVNTTIPRFLLD
jgi:hypothetical protein